MTSCALPSDSKKTDLLAVDFLSFQLTTGDNPGLPSSVNGTIDGDHIYLNYPDSLIPGFYWIPRFDTDAVSVEIDGQPQYSGAGAVDFSNPVTYTLTSSSGGIKQVTVELVLNGGWQDMGINPAVPAGPGIYNIRNGLLLNVNPYVVFMDSAATLRAFILGVDDGNWAEDYSTAPPAGMVSFDTITWKSSIWSVYETNVGNVESQFSVPSPLPAVPPYTWSGAELLMVTAGTKDLQVFNGSEDRIFAAWIEDPSVTSVPVVWTRDSAGPWVQVGGGITGFHADTMAAVSGGGTELYLVCTFAENPGTLQMFKYRYVEDDWQWTTDAGSLFKEDEQEVFDLFYDTNRQTPVVFTLLPSRDDPGFYELRALYWSKTAALWTNLNSITPLTVSAGSVPSLSVSWYENIPSVAAGSSVLTWKEGRWQTVGSQYTSDTPALQSLTTGILGTFFTAYTTDPLSGELRVRMLQ